MLGGDHFRYALLNNRSLASVDEVDLGLLRVDTHETVTFIGKTAHAYATDVSKSEDANIHEFPNSLERRRWRSHLDSNAER
jgi:hypothetical protein